MRYGLQHVILLVVFGLVTGIGDVRADVFTDVPTAKGYTLIYELEIPLRGGFIAKQPNYKIDRSQSTTGSFARIAYYLSLQPKQGKRQFVFVSMDAFTQQLAHIGVPDGTRKVQWQQRIDNMDVVSNVPGIKTGQGITTGNIEFWPTNYQTTNGAAVPKASNTVYDTGDTPIPTGQYGSMQIHNYALGQTLFAYNNWGGSNSNSDLGIGNNAVKFGNVTNTDWTFRRNAADYTQRQLQILVLPGKPPAGLRIDIKHPQPHQIQQRQPGNMGWIPVEGSFLGNADRVEARAISRKGGRTSSWQLVTQAPQNKTFTGKIKAVAGWYDIELRTLRNGQVQDSKKVGPVGVGEVFLIAGQSNSANHGEAITQATDPRVTNYGNGRWRPAIDPMLVATGTKGSPWPTFGDLMAKRWDVPIGILSVGVGGTRVQQWLPTTTNSLYPRIKAALQAVGPKGIRAILWHQGESDSAANTTAAQYATRMEAVIKQSRTDGGWDIPWYIALVSYLPRTNAQQEQRVIAGQKQVIASHPMNFTGPTTDDLLGKQWRYDFVHFNVPGLKEHARRWAQVISLPACKGFPNSSHEHICESTPEPQPDAVEPNPQDTTAPDAAIDSATNDVPTPREFTPEPRRDNGREPPTQGDKGNNDTKRKELFSPPEPQRETTTSPETARDQASQPPQRRGCGCASTTKQNEADKAQKQLWFGWFLVLCVCLVLGRRKNRPSRQMNE